MGETKVVHTHKAYSRPEELTNFITYALAAVLSFAGLVFLLLEASSSGIAAHIAAAVVAGVTPLAVFAAGAFCHLPLAGRGVALLRRTDRCAVAVLLAGAMSAVLLFVSAAGDRNDRIWAYTLVPIMLSAAVAAVAVSAANVREHKAISLVMYVILGAAAVMYLARIVELCGWDGGALLYGGAAAYFVGVVVCSFDRLPARHTLWHLFVITGAALHFVCIYSFLL